jgi:hypothetical protein
VSPRLGGTGGDATTAHLSSLPPRASSPLPEASQPARMVAAGPFSFVPFSPPCGSSFRRWWWLPRQPALGSTAPVTGSGALEARSGAPAWIWSGHSRRRRRRAEGPGSLDGSTRRPTVDGARAGGCARTTPGSFSACRFLSHGASTAAVATQARRGAAGRSRHGQRRTEGPGLVDGSARRPAVDGATPAVTSGSRWRWAVTHRLTRAAVPVTLPSVVGGWCSRRTVATAHGTEAPWRKPCTSWADDGDAFGRRFLRRKCSSNGPLPCAQCVFLR